MEMDSKIPARFAGLIDEQRQKIYDLGYQDGLAFDLDGYASIEAVRRDAEGWDEGLINGLGWVEVLRLFGLPGDAWGSDEYYAACGVYNRGCHDGACAPQEKRTGLPPGSND